MLTKNEHSPSDPTISVVVTTYGRPHLLGRAIQSVLAQTARPSEIIVVVDGPDLETLASLNDVVVPNLRVITLPTRSGVSVSRNVGVANAAAEWIAFLDDDDEWLPQKLQSQIRAACGSGLRYPIVCSRILVRTPEGDFVMPRRRPERSESIADYLFNRRTLRPGEVLLQTSNLLAPASLLKNTLFRPGQWKWNDTDWLLRAGQVDGVGLEFVEDTLSIWNTDDMSRETITNKASWRYLLDWAVSNRDLFSARAFSGVLLIRLSSEAAAERDWPAFMMLFREAFRRGSPNALQLLWFCGTFCTGALLPARWYVRLRTILRSSLFHLAV